MPEESKPLEGHPEDEELLPLPPLDDDESEAIEGYEGLSLDDPHLTEARCLDDATAEDEPFEAWGIETPPEERGLLEDAEASTQAQAKHFDDEGELLPGEERGLLHDSDEGDGRDVHPDEAGLLADDHQGSIDDGGAEGTGEDPAAAIDRDGGEAEVAPGGNPDDESIDDELLEAPWAADARAAFEREPWPGRADRSWAVDVPRDEDVPTSPSADRRPGPRRADAALVATAGAVVATWEPGRGLWVSRDEGEHFERVSGCGAATAVSVLPDGRGVVVALHDAALDATCLALVRLVAGAAVSAEIVAELVSCADAEDESARVLELHARTRSDGKAEVFALGAFGVRRAIG